MALGVNDFDAGKHITKGHLGGGGGGAENWDFFGFLNGIERKQQVHYKFLPSNALSSAMDLNFFTFLRLFSDEIFPGEKLPIYRYRSVKGTGKF